MRMSLFGDMAIIEVKGSFQTWHDKIQPALELFATRIATIIGDQYRYEMVRLYNHRPAFADKEREDAFQHKGWWRPAE